MFEINPLLQTDFYKTIHHECYKPGTEKLYFYWTARTSRIEDVHDVTFFGLQAFIKKYLISDFDEYFFNMNYEDVMLEYTEFLYTTLGKRFSENEHIGELYDLGYLPLEIKAVPEGMRVPIGCPMVEITNTDSRFFWLPGYIETLYSSAMWMPTTTATIARRYRQLLNYVYLDSGLKEENAAYAATDFSQRGMTSPESAMVNGAAHLLYFNKTANIPSINWAQYYYDASMKDFQNAGTASTEHSVMCTYEHDEYEAFRRLLELYPEGNLSIVSDTYNLWNVITKILVAPEIHDMIMKRNGTVLIRPDSGNPADIICGSNSSDTHPAERLGVVETLYWKFNGTINNNGLITLDPHIKVVYGDAITYDRAETICRRLKSKGFAPDNVVFGIGSYTYQYNTRDTFGFALKATHAIIDGKDVPLYKDPVTDKGGFKKSQKGMCVVFRKDGDIKYEDGLTKAQAEERTDNLLTTVFKDGRLKNRTKFSELRERCRNGI